MLDMVGKFSEQMKSALAVQNLKKYGLSKVSGVAEGLLSRYESGKQVPDDNTIQKLAPFLGVPFSVLKAAAVADRVAVTLARLGGTPPMADSDDAPLQGVVSDLAIGMDKIISGIDQAMSALDPDTHPALVAARARAVEIQGMAISLMGTWDRELADATMRLLVASSDAERNAIAQEIDLIKLNMSGTAAYERAKAEAIRIRQSENRDATKSEIQSAASQGTPAPTQIFTKRNTKYDNDPHIGRIASGNTTVNPKWTEQTDGDFRE
jgi:transcriptional regulator with XRE-family HTH domain